MTENYFGIRTDFKRNLDEPKHAMTIPFSGGIRLLSLVCLTVWAGGPSASAQTKFNLRLQMQGNRPLLSITGAVGNVYSLQYASNLVVKNCWTELTLLEVQGTNNVWVDSTDVSQSQRCYRAVSVPLPADTNLVFIPPGTFMMGSPTNEIGGGSYETQHIVTFRRGFWMGRHLVTQGEYYAMVGLNPSYFTGTNGFSQDLTRPVEQVSWDDATNYCAMRTMREQAGGLISTNLEYRLPTESEWEYACRAGTTTAFYLGSWLRSGNANFDGQYEYDASAGDIFNGNGIYLQTTTPVGSYAANSWGLYDMIGNVFEWCQDWYGAYPIGPVTDPKGAVSGTSRVARGGCWSYHAQFCRSAVRGGATPEFKQNTLGFRVVLARTN